MVEKIHAGRLTTAKSGGDSFMYKILFLLSLLLCGGCATNTPSYTKSTINGSVIENKTIGFSGLHMELPASYVEFPPLPKGTSTNSNAQWAWSMSTDYDKKTGYAQEHIAFAKGDYGITLALVFRSFSVDTKLLKGDLISNMDRVARAVVFPAGEIDLKEAKEVGDYVVARSGRKLKEYARYNVVYQVSLPPRYLLVINGVCPLGKEKTLFADIEAAIKTLKYK